MVVVVVVMMVMMMMLMTVTILFFCDRVFDEPISVLSVSRC